MCSAQCSANSCIHIRATLGELWHFCRFSLDRVYIAVQLDMFVHMPLSWYRVMISENQSILAYKYWYQDLILTTFMDYIIYIDEYIYFHLKYNYKCQNWTFTTSYNDMRYWTIELHSVICDKTSEASSYKYLSVSWQQQCSVYIHFTSAFHQSLDYFPMVMHTLKRLVTCVAYNPNTKHTVSAKYEVVCSIRWESSLVTSCLMGIQKS